MKNTKELKKTKVSLIIIALLTIALCISISCNSIIVAQADNINADDFEEKVYSDINIEDDFDDSSVMVVLDKKISGINKNHSSLFSKLSFVKALKDLTKLTGEIKDKLFLNKNSYRQIFKIELKESSKQNVIDAVNEIQQLEGVLWAGVNIRYTPDDIEENHPPAMSGTNYRFQWGLSAELGINAKEAWNYTKGGITKVGIIDSGIAVHPDLNSNVIKGWNFVDDNDNTEDTLGHGTAVAGIIGANGSSENGVMGVNWRVQMVPLKVDLAPVKEEPNEKETVKFDSSAIVKAINWAIDNNVEILNSSYYSNTDSAANKAAINNFKGLIVCSAGNNKNNNDEIKQYPSDYSQGQEFSDRIISVGAITYDQKLWDSLDEGTNYGKSTVSIFAPGGENILTTSHTGEYIYFGGTSAAAPFVTGVASLLFSKYSFNAFGLTESEIATEIKSTILKYSTKDEEYVGKCVCGGKLNAAEPLKNLLYIKNVVNDFGYNDNWYRWKGQVDLHLSNLGSYKYNDNNDIVIISNTVLDFGITSAFTFNAVTSINGTLSAKISDSYGNVIQSASKQLRIGLLSNLSSGYGSIIALDTSNLPNGAYTFTLECSTSRKDNSYYQIKTYTFYIDR